VDDDQLCVDGTPIKFTWRHRSKTTELTKVRLRLCDYNTSWVLFDANEKPSKKRGAKGPKAAKKAKKAK
jgi:hypothetical protein